MSFFKKFVTKYLGNKNETRELDWADLSKELLQSDLGRELTQKLVDSLKGSKEDPLLELTSKLETLFSKKSRSTNPGVILIVGVNGTGKTTSAAKLANHLPGESLLVAGDTFRAAAVEQLSIWGERLGIEVISGSANSDPAAVVFDATKRFKEGRADNLIIDTAGRLHNKVDLMAELSKIKKVVEKSAKVSEVLLVIDAVTGQNGLAQAEIFLDTLEVTGIILTKLDGSARGGIALAIENRFNIPIKWVANGESVNDFETFDPKNYIKGLLS